jgi:hypothetical protein
MKRTAISRDPKGEIATAIIGMDRRRAIMIRLRRRRAFAPGTGGGAISLSLINRINQSANILLNISN